MIFSTSSPTYPASVSVVASTMANGTSSIRESVCASRVFPVPVGPIKRILDLLSSTSPRWSRGLFALLILQNRLANAHTLVADVRPRVVRRRTDQLFHLFLGLVAEGTAQGLVWAIFFHV